MDIPNNNSWTQTNNGFISGVLHSSHNLNFDMVGEARLSKKAIALIDSTTADFGEVMSISYFNSYYYLVTDDHVFKGNLTDGSFSAVASSPTLTTGTDSVVCYSRLYVSDTTTLAYYNGSAWTTGIGSISSSYPHPLAVFDSQPTYKLAVGNGSEVQLYNSSGTASGTVLSLPSNFVATSIAYRNGYLYIATKETSGNEAAVFVWNGESTDADYKIDAGAAWVYSITPYRSSVVAVTNEGELLLISGSSTQKLAAFPVYSTPGARWETGDAVRGKVYPRAMVAIGDNIYINISGRVDIGSCPEMRSGVWCYDPNIGLYHYASPTTNLLKRHSSSDGLSISGSEFTTPSSHGLQTGDTILFFTTSSLVGVESDVNYFAIVTATNKLKLATTREDAFNGDSITITGSVGVLDIMAYSSCADYGQTTNADSGAVAVNNYLDSPSGLFESDIIFASELKNQSGTEVDVLCTLTQKRNIGSFTTQRIYTSGTSDSWKAVYAFINGVRGTNESVIIRTKEEHKQHFPTKEIVGSWVNSNTFNTTDKTLRNSLESGLCAEFVSGYGQGQYANVTDFSTSLETTTIVFDENYGVAGQSSTIRLDNFYKKGEIESGNITAGQASAVIGKQSAWEQIMVELRGFEPSVAKLKVSSVTSKNVL